MAVAAIQYDGKKQGRRGRLFYVTLMQRNPHPNRSDNIPSPTACHDVAFVYYYHPTNLSLSHAPYTKWPPLLRARACTRTAGISIVNPD